MHSSIRQQFVGRVLLSQLYFHWAMGVNDSLLRGLTTVNDGVVNEGYS